MIQAPPVPGAPAASYQFPYLGMRVAVGSRRDRSHSCPPVRDRRGIHFRQMSIAAADTLGLEVDEPAATASEEQARQVEISADGRTTAVVGVQAVSIFVAGARRLRILRPQVQVAALSPAGGFLLTWERATKESNEPNLLVWDLAACPGGDAAATAFSCGLIWRLYSKAKWPPISWSADERFAAFSGSEGLFLLPPAPAAIQALVTGDRL
jgi:hypothetical protein